MKINKRFTFLIIGILTLSIISFLSCNKGDVLPDQTISADAIVLSTGSIAADGCGWLIKTDGQDSIFSATNLDAQYQVDKLKVRIIYKKLDSRFYCGQLPAPQNKGITQIQLNSVTTR